MMEEKPIRVFLADDHVMVREGLAAVLAREPDIEVVGQEGQGLAVVNSILECQPDVLVLDIMMPGINGLEICRELLRKNKKTAVLILTMYDDEQFIVRALEYGASGYLLKEVASNQLATAVRAVARGELYLGPGIPRHVIECIGRGRADPYEQLTTRERQVLQLITEGKTSREVAKELDLAVKTVDTHRAHLMQKLNIHDQTSLVKFAIRRGIVSAR
jgi:DNA-binding NarL/FixJ family response regulator